MSLRLGSMILCAAPLALGCGGAPKASDAPLQERKVSTLWRRERPYVTPWGTGADRIPASRKPHFFCDSPEGAPDSAFCSATEDECRRARPKGVCEPVAMAACIPALQGCYPTMTACDKMLKKALADMGGSRGPADPGLSCAWQGGAEPPNASRSGR